MTTLHHRQRQRLRQGRRPFRLSLAGLAFLLLASASALSPVPTRQVSSGVKEIIREEEVAGRVQARRRLGGLGSSPPTCRSKCGVCAPCTAVHVPIQPGWSMPLEYYPEAWRCKCGDNIFMP